VVCDPADYEPLVLLDSCSRDGFGASWRFRGYVAILVAHDPEKVAPLLDRVERLAGEGLFSVGYVAYEAAAALNPDLPPLAGMEGLPLAWFALYRERYPAAGEVDGPTDAGDVPELEPALSPEEYVAGLESIRGRIGRGESYQVNYTFPLTGDFRGEPLPLYRRISRGQRASFSAYLDTGRHVIMSASPELFFSRSNGVITTRPMKGTAPRGRWSVEDDALAAALLASPKERAENLMIVDLLRSDLGIVAETGTVRVDGLFSLERYPTVHQLTSTVSAGLRPGTSLAEIFRALFPCGSVTGAPKRRSMEIIRGLEKSPRGVYCGAIGSVAPGGEATFSVAIRTLLLDRETGRLGLHVGSGVTWDSRGMDEYRECLGKGAFLQADSEPFVLIETMGRESGVIPRLERHLGRLAASAGYFGFPFDREKALALLATAAERSGPLRLRLTLDERGEFTLTASPLVSDSTPLRLGMARATIEPKDPFRYHKTSRRELLDRERLGRADRDEVVFVNRRGELTEGSYHTLVLRLGGRLVTPRLESGLLPGILRQELLDAGEIGEAPLYPDDLERAEEIWLINSLRGWRRAVMEEN
jgi:para-aminobenzoate synthetase/4-amino-4-deoxychorismate lyase